MLMKEGVVIYPDIIGMYCAHLLPFIAISCLSIIHIHLSGLSVCSVVFLVFVFFGTVKGNCEDS